MLPSTTNTPTITDSAGNINMQNPTQTTDIGILFTSNTATYYCEITQGEYKILKSNSSVLSIILDQFEENDMNMFKIKLNVFLSKDLIQGIVNVLTIDFALKCDANTQLELSDGETCSISDKHLIILIRHVFNKQHDIIANVLVNTLNFRFTVLYDKIMSEIICYNSRCNKLLECMIARPSVAYNTFITYVQSFCPISISDNHLFNDSDILCACEDKNDTTVFDIICNDRMTSIINTNLNIEKTICLCSDGLIDDNFISSMTDKHFISGGFILECLNGSFSKNSDIDFWVCDADEQTYLYSVMSLVNIINNRLGEMKKKALWSVHKNVITIHPVSLEKNIQIIISLDNIGTVIDNFDTDYVKAYYCPLSRLVLGTFEFVRSYSNKKVYSMRDYTTDKRVYKALSKGYTISKELDTVKIKTSNGEELLANIVESYNNLKIDLKISIGPVYNNVKLSVPMADDKRDNVACLLAYNYNKYYMPTYEEYVEFEHATEKYCSRAYFMINVIFGHKFVTTDIQMIPKKINIVFDKKPASAILMRRPKSTGSCYEALHNNHIWVDTNNAVLLHDVIENIPCVTTSKRGITCNVLQIDNNDEKYMFYIDTTLYHPLFVFKMGKYGNLLKENKCNITCNNPKNKIQDSLKKMMNDIKKNIIEYDPRHKKVVCHPLCKHYTMCSKKHECQSEYCYCAQECDCSPYQDKICDCTFDQEEDCDCTFDQAAVRLNMHLLFCNGNAPCEESVTDNLKTIINVNNKPVKIDKLEDINTFVKKNAKVRLYCVMDKVSIIRKRDIDIMYPKLYLVRIDV
jgi:hypothetical protein